MRAEVQQNISDLIGSNSSTSSMRSFYMYHNSIQFWYLHAPTNKLSRWRAQRTQKTWSPGGGLQEKKVSFQFNFEIVQRETRVAQVHWKCIPDSRRCEIEIESYTQLASRHRYGITPTHRRPLALGGKERWDRNFLSVGPTWGPITLAQHHHPNVGPTLLS